MKSTFHSVLVKLVLLIAPWSLYLCRPTMTHAGERDVLYAGPVKSAHLHDRAELPPGFLTVYSATDEFNDGGAFYFPHSSYVIYAADGKLLKNVENHISRNDEIPEVVALPAGSYMVEARSEKEGYVRVRVVIKAAQRTVLDLDLPEKESPRRLAHS